LKRILSPARKACLSAAAALAFSLTVTALPPPEAGPALSPPVRKYLLAVGINDYTFAQPLKGCVNDATGLTATLTGAYGFDRTGSTLVVNAEATRARIIGALEHYSRLVTAGDLFVFYYSGHGYLFPDQASPQRDETRALNLAPLRAAVRGFSLPDGYYDSVIVPVDALDAAGRRPWRNFILDDELFAFFAQMTARGASVVMIADSCHSGTLGRALSTNATPKFASPDQLGFVQEALAARQVSGPIVASDLRGAYLAISAAEDDQFSWDGQPGGEDHGFFTYSLLKALAHKPGERRARLSYRELFEQAKAGAEALVGRLGLEQTPRLDTRYFNRSLNEPAFGVPESGEQSAPPVALRLLVQVESRDGQPLSDSVFALYKPEIRSVPARASQGDLLALLKTDASGLAASPMPVALPGEYWIKVVRRGYRSSITRVSLSQNPRRRGEARLLIRLDPE
jgi:hypothetical protein